MRVINLALNIMDKKVQRNFLWVALLVLGTIGILARHNRAIPYRTASGLIFGTVYNITRYPLSTIRPPLRVSTETKTSSPTLSLLTYSAAAWKYPKRPEGPLTLQ